MEWKASRYFSGSGYFLQRTQFLSNMMTKMLTVCRETLGVYCEDRTKLTNPLCRSVTSS